MKFIGSIIVLTYVSMVGSYAQAYKQTETVQFINHKIILPDGGTMEEALSLTQNWTESVLRKNENFEEVRLFLSDVEQDTVELLVLYKIKKDVSRSTNEIIQELIKTRWPGDGEFEKFLQQLHEYIDPKLNEKSLFRELIMN